MAVYEYTAKDQGRKKFSGTYSDVDSVAVLRDELAKVGCVLIRAHTKKKRASRRKRIKQSEILTFVYKFAGMYSAGLPILRCLESLEEPIENQTFKSVIADIIRGVESGSSLTTAFGRYRNIFSDFFLGMLEVGETGGKLAKTLELSTEYLEKQDELKRKVRAAFAYPITVTVVCLIVVSFLLVYIVPVFSKLYKQLHVSLPVPTRILVGISSIIRDRWWAVLIVAGAAAIVLAKLSKNPYIRQKWDVFKLNMPLFGKLNRMVVVSRFMRTFAMLAAVGISLTKAFEIANQVANNHKMKEITKGLQHSIAGGHSIASSLKVYDIFPQMITQLTASGEEAGKLPEMLNKGVDFLDKDIDRTVKALLTKLEPILTVIMGAIVGFLLMGVYLPMFDYMSQVQK